MKVIFAFALLLGVIGDLSAYPVEWTAENRRIEAEQVAIWKSKLVEAQGEPPDARPAILGLGLRNMAHRRQNYDNHSPTVDAMYLSIQEALLSIPNHARYFADEIKREQKEVSNYPMNTGPRVSYDFNRNVYFQTLRHLPSPETISVLGEFLSDDTDTPTVRISPDSDWGENPRANSYHSSWTIMNIGLRDPPVATEDRNVDVDERLARTRAWWETVRSGSRSFSFVGQPVEYRFKPDGSWETIPISVPPKDAAVRPDFAPGERPNKRQQTVTVAEHSKVATNGWVWVFGASAALIAGLAGFLLSRRKV